MCSSNQLQDLYSHGGTISARGTLYHGPSNVIYCPTNTIYFFLKMFLDLCAILRNVIIPVLNYCDVIFMICVSI